MFQKVMALTLVAGMASAAAAQFDPDAFWPYYKGGPTTQGSKTVNSGPAVNHEWTITTDQPASVGGLCFGSDGMMYFKSRTGDGSLPKVYKVNPANGAVLASSPGLDGDNGSYAGVSLGVDYIWTTVTTVAGGPRVSKIVKLNYSDLSVAGEFTNPDFDDDSLGLRGAPLIGSVPNQRGNVNLYVHMRGDTAGSFPAGLIHAVDSVTGDLDWSYDPLMGNSTFFGLLGPMWEVNGKEYIAYFGNQAVASGVCVRDNADGTFTEVWFGGPDNFNWLGTGALNDDQDTIYVTTFNDGDTPSLWAVDALTGSQNWAVPGHRGTIMENNFFGRPAVMERPGGGGPRVYTCGAFGLITCWDDNGSSYDQPWSIRPEAVEDPNNPGHYPDNNPGVPSSWATMQDFLNSGEITAYTVVDAQTRGGTQRYIYAVMQQQPTVDASDPLIAQLIVVRDDGDSGTVVMRTTLDDTMLPTRYGNSSPTVNEEGDLFVVGGSSSVTGADAGEIYKFSTEEAGCEADRNNDGLLDFFDVQDFLNDFSAHDPSADLIPDGSFDFFDVQRYLNLFSAGCP